MHQLKEMLGELSILFTYPKNLLLLLTRLLLAYSFTMPALLKINDLQGTQTWFKEMHIPFADFFSYLVSGLETFGIVLLILGLFTRYISLLLMCVMLGAILFVHLSHGFSVSNNGIEIPLYYFLFLSILASYGAGKYALDTLILKECEDD